MKNKMYSIRIDEKLLNDYREFCEENSINISARIRKFMEREIEGWAERKRMNEANRKKLAEAKIAEANLLEAKRKKLF